MTYHFSSKEIEDQISRYPLKFLPERNPQIEWMTKLPMFINTFHKIVKETGRIPSQDEFVEVYFKDNSEELAKIIKNDVSLTRGIEARLRRTYPSFVRDIHFNALLKERGLDAKYDVELDVKEGIDSVITHKGKKFFAHCFVNTKRGKDARSVKNARHDFHGTHLDIALDLGSRKTRRVGDFMLYSETHVDELITYMEQERDE